MEEIKLNFPPAIILALAKRIAADAKKDKNVAEPQLLFMEDVVKLVEVAVGVLKPAAKENKS